MIRAARAELTTIGIHQAPDVVLAAGGDSNVPQIETLVIAAQRRDHQPRQQRPRTPPPPDHASCATSASTASTRTCSASSQARSAQALYRQRQHMIEPIFAQTKVTRRADRFQRRGLQAFRSGMATAGRLAQPPQALPARPRRWIGAAVSSSAPPQRGPSISPPIPAKPRPLRDSLRRG